jgi:DNA-binding response OmpR family regulator
MNRMFPIEAEQSRCPTILCIDDDPEITDALRIRFRKYDVDVLTAYHGMLGYWLATTEHPDLVITDLRMPQGEGKYVVECLRNNAATCAIPVIVLTGQRGAELSRELKRLDVEIVLTKPVLFDDLIAAAAKFVPLNDRDDEETSPCRA